VIEFIQSDAGCFLVFLLMFAPAFAFDFLFKRGHTVEVSEALKWSGFWVLFAVLYGWFLFWAKGTALAVPYMAAFFTEKALSVDNLFVFTLVFGLFGITGKEQQRALGYGILGAIIARVVFLTVGGALLSYLPWLVYPLAALLIFTGVSALKGGDEKEPKGLQWAKALGLSFPLPLLGRADEVIE
jgi:tellurite resistance protein TerC